MAQMIERAEIVLNDYVLYLCTASSYVMQVDQGKAQFTIFRPHIFSSRHCFCRWDFRIATKNYIFLFKETKQLVLICLRTNIQERFTSSVPLFFTRCSSLKKRDIIF